MKTIYFVRHGLSEANVLGVTSGGEHAALLTPEGRRQATEAGRRLKDKKIDLIVCSPMKRAIETARCIAAETGIVSTKILTNQDFIERFMGKYSGKPHTLYRADVKSGNIHASVESAAALHKRVSRGLEWLKQLSAQNIVLVSHGATGRMVKVIDQGLHHDDIYKIEGFENTEIYEFTL